MLKGYMGKLARVDLTTGEISYQELTDDFCRNYIGGAGFATKIIYDETTAETDPFSAENPLVFMTGPVAGTSVPSTGRYVVSALSPLTNIYGQAHGGGGFAQAIKRAGLDGIIIKGIASEPVYLWVTDEGIEIRKAAHLWGKDTWDTDELVKAETSTKANVVAIGLAGEKLVRFACIVGDGREGRVAGRCGLGAVMGSKNLKAIAVNGTKKPEVYAPEKLQESIKKDFIDKKIDMKAYAERMVPGLTALYNSGRHTIRNYETGTYKVADNNKFREFWVDGLVCTENPYYCKGCMSSCIESRMEGNRRHLTEEVLFSLGAKSEVDDLKTLQGGYDLCNRYGIEGMSMGGVIAMALELYEKGIITQEDTGGMELKPGDKELLLKLIEMVAKRDGFGRLLGEGVKRMAEQIGGLASEYAMHIKGHEFPIYDIRAWNAGALEWSTASSGCHHYEGTTPQVIKAIRAFGADHLIYLNDEEKTEIANNLFAVRGVGKLVAWGQDWGNYLDSMVMCKFTLGGIQSGQDLHPNTFIDWLNCVTGLEVDLENALEIGERIFTLKRQIGVRRGISRKDDMPPLRFLTEKRGSGENGTADNLPPMGQLLHDYYAHRKWTEVGIPSIGKLQALGLQA